MIRLNCDCQANIEWWVLCGRSSNGTFLLSPIHQANSDINFWLDASGSWNCGVYWRELWVFEGSRLFSNVSIGIKVPVLVSIIIWGPYWKGLKVCCHSDNTAVVTVINQQLAKDALLSHLLCCLYFQLP